MRTISAVSQPKQYNPAKLLDVLLDYLELKDDAALAEVLGIPKSAICKMRHGTIPIGSSILLAMEQASGLKSDRLLMLLASEEPSSLSASKQNRLPISRTMRRPSVPAFAFLQHKQL